MCARMDCAAPPLARSCLPIWPCAPSVCKQHSMPSTAYRLSDIGLPQLSMHSIREMCGVADVEHMINLISVSRPRLVLTLIPHRHSTSTSPPWTRRSSWTDSSTLHSLLACLSSARNTADFSIEDVGVAAGGGARLCRRARCVPACSGLRPLCDDETPLFLARLARP